MASYLDKYRVGPIRWIVYPYHGEIKVQAGYISNSRTFVSADKNSWLVRIPSSFMKVGSRGKVLCRSEEEIPIAKQMVKEYCIKKIDEVGDSAISALYNIQHIIEDTQ